MKSTIITENAIVDIFVNLKVERCNDCAALDDSFIKVTTVRIRNEFKTRQHTSHYKLMEITKEEYPKPRRKSGLGKSIKVLKI